MGIDKVPGEIMKALNNPLLHKELAKVFNESFEKNIHIEAIGAGILTPLAKPGKTRGPVNVDTTIDPAECFKKDPVAYSAKQNRESCGQLHRTIPSCLQSWQELC